LCDVLPIFLFLDNLFKPDFCLQETNDKLNQIVNSTENYHCHYNSKIFKSKAKLVSHSRNHKFPKKYSCNQCSAQFFKHAALRQHSLICSKSNVNNLNCIDVPAPQKETQVVTDVKNVEKEYKSLDCGKIFSHYKYLHKHKKMHEGIIYHCVQCPSTYKSIYGLKYHSRTVHKVENVTDVKNVEKEYKCLECGKIFSCYQKFYHHKKMHEGIRYRCVQCLSTYKTMNGLDYHSKTHHHDLPKFECHHCQTTFRAKGTLKAHMSLHFNSIEKEYKCLECGKIFSNYKKLYHHKKVHEGIIYCCAQCPLTYQTKSSLNYHSKTQHELRKFECHHCQTTFKAKLTLQRHMSLHFNSIGYKCNHCSKFFNSNAKLVSHCREHKFPKIDKCIDVSASKKQVPVEKSCKCLKCNIIFSNYQKWYKHQETHAKIYRCVQRPSTYKTTDELRNHTRTVHELRLFECHHCQTTFKGKRYMKRHVSLHFNSIVYPCNQCSEIFETNNMLVSHRNFAHLNYQCHYCSKMFNAESSLKSHIMMSHCIKHKFFNIDNCIDVPASQKQAQVVIDVQRKKEVNTHKSPKEKYPCRECPKIFNSITDLSAHMLEQCFAEGF
jgi:KRAB domain-containing zinc finger protein